jgi:hypothetical protein
MQDISQSTYLRRNPISVVLKLTLRKVSSNADYGSCMANMSDLTYISYQKQPYMYMMASWVHILCSLSSKVYSNYYQENAVKLTYSLPDGWKTYSLIDNST